MNDNLEAIRERAIARVRDVPVTDVRPQSRLEDLGVDSLAITEIIVEVELELDREFPIHLLREMERLYTVEELATAMGSALTDADQGQGLPSTPPN
jgi:acyl carrier protein